MTRSNETSYDVIIVGARPAGASLAARLGQRGLRVLVVDRASFPSQPAVPACPVLYPPAMHMLDEIGVLESTYEHATTRVSTFVVEFDDRFKATMAVPEAFGRRYVFGLDRARLDEVLWKHLGKYPSITARERFGVMDLVRDDRGRVIGVRGSAKDGGEEVLFAKICVVGADGRFSLVARKAGAKVVEDVKRTSSVHYAEWENLAPCIPDRQPAIHIVASGKGKNALVFPSIEGRFHIAIHARSDRVDLGGDAQRYYMDQLHSFAAVRSRIAGARQVGPVLGVKPVANRYLEHGGAGWVLVGDALHHKDPIDGQGIYDALLESKLLADNLVAVHEGRLSWDTALASYHRAVTRDTEPMFRASMKRLENDLYTEPPELMVRTLIRWLINDPDYQRCFLLLLCRSVSPDDWLPPQVFAKAVLRGVGGDIAEFVRRAIDAGRMAWGARSGAGGRGEGGERDGDTGNVTGLEPPPRGPLPPPPP